MYGGQFHIVFENEKSQTTWDLACSEKKLRTRLLSLIQVQWRQIFDSDLVISQL